MSDDSFRVSVICYQPHHSSITYSTPKAIPAALLDKVSNIEALAGKNLIRLDFNKLGKMALEIIAAGIVGMLGIEDKTNNVVSKALKV